MAITIFVVSASLMLARGVRLGTSACGHADVALVLGSGAEEEQLSAIPDEDIAVIQNASVRHTAMAAAPEFVASIVMRRLRGEARSTVVLRGTSASSMALRPELRLIIGRRPAPGAAEMMIGRRLAATVAGMGLGREVSLGVSTVTIVGVFDAGGSAYESEGWLDIDTLRTAYHRTGTVSSVRLPLASEAELLRLRESLEQDRRLSVMVERESEFYGRRVAAPTTLVTSLGALVGFFFALGAMLSASISMYAAVASRRREIATLRILGFSRASILTSFLVESLLLGLSGGALGLAASAMLARVDVPVPNANTFSQTVFDFRLSAVVVVSSIVTAAVLGLLGGLPPAIAATRVRPVEGLRA